MFSSLFLFSHTTDSFPSQCRLARSKFVESFNLAQNGSSVDDDPEVLASNGYGTQCSKSPKKSANWSQNRNPFF